MIIPKHVWVGNNSEGVQLEMGAQSDHGGVWTQGRPGEIIRPQPAANLEGTLTMEGRYTGL